MRSYGQFCGLAKGLDVVGDRWTLLIVRELLIRGASRYSDLRAGLPGIPTNLLADRLRELEEARLLPRRMVAAPGDPRACKPPAPGDGLRPGMPAVWPCAAPPTAAARHGCG